VRADVPPLIDGRDDDAVWRIAPAITAFRQFQPVEDAEPRYRTEVKVAYDAHNFYVFIRAFDAHPDSILKLLARRDIRTASDQLKIIVDSYHDRRTGYEFAVNPAGVKRDYAVYDDANEDDAWTACGRPGRRSTRSAGRPSSASPSPRCATPRADQYVRVCRVAGHRPLHRARELAAIQPEAPGFDVTAREVTGLDGLAAPRRLEVAPYFVTKNVPLDGPGFDRAQKIDGGADIKYGLTSNITIDATVNPDFGQVEADPSVLNLGPFETFYQERRPFFIEGTGIFQFGVNCSVVNCSGEGLFYSRRVEARPASSAPPRSPGGCPAG